jgi:hypothetical protein
MRLELRRHFRDETATIGELFINGAYACATLEDAIQRGPKIPGRSAIPAGSYRVIIAKTTLADGKKFDGKLPLILDVPGFDMIRIHAGNTPEDTKGCILVGLRWRAEPPMIFDSQTALKMLMLQLGRAKGPITLDIVDEEEVQAA